jgi:hypothetical protein
MSEIVGYARDNRGDAPFKPDNMPIAFSEMTIFCSDSKSLIQCAAQKAARLSRVFEASEYFQGLPISALQIRQK